MGYDIFPVLILDGHGGHELSEEEENTIIGELFSKYDIQFMPNCADGEWYAEEVRWGSMEEDLCRMSKHHPGVLFKCLYEWEDHTRYCTFALNGKTYEISQEEFNPDLEEEYLR